jgi:uroporphyrinogen decarboxylase
MTNDTMLRAARREPVEHTPIWLMRQAGRYMAVYRAVRERHGFLQMVKTPEVAAEVTMQPIEAFGMDAAIIFADILPPLEGLGLQLTFEKGEGPVIHNPIRTVADVASLRPYDPHEASGYTLEALRIVRRALEGRATLIGFSGAPFTMASYAIEGGGSREHRLTKKFMYHEPEAWHSLMERLSRLVSDYLLAQVAAGAQVVQIFDSWGGVLSPDDFREFVLPYVTAAVDQVHAGSDVPVIYFGTDLSGMLGVLRETNADVIGLDWRIDFDEGWARIGHDRAVQGNLDPVLLHGPWPLIERRAKAILDRAGGRPGHIFNLGHGILTETPEDNVRRLVEYVQAYRYAG